jgi:transposase
MVWMDQTGIENTLDYAYGYCHKSERFMAEKLGHRTERVSLIGAWREGEFLAPMLFEGYTNSELVCGWIEEMLLPEMLPGQILILDNASFHPKKRIQELLAKAGCDVMFLPPYSSDLNKIEKYWARLKHEVSQVLEAGMSLIDTIAQVIRLMS